MAGLSRILLVLWASGLLGVDAKWNLLHRKDDPDLPVTPGEDPAATVQLSTSSSAIPASISPGNKQSHSVVPISLSVTVPVDKFSTTSQLAAPTDAEPPADAAPTSSETTQPAPLIPSFSENPPPTSSPPNPATSSTESAPVIPPPSTKDSEPSSPAASPSPVESSASSNVEPPAEPSTTSAPEPSAPVIPSSSNTNPATPSERPTDAIEPAATDGSEAEMQPPSSTQAGQGQGSTPSGSPEPTTAESPTKTAEESSVTDGAAVTSGLKSSPTLSSEISQFTSSMPIVISNIQNWIDNPDPTKKGEAVKAIDDNLDKAKDITSKGEVDTSKCDGAKRRRALQARGISVISSIADDIGCAAEALEDTGKILKDLAEDATQEEIDNVVEKVKSNVDDLKDSQSNVEDDVKGGDGDDSDNDDDDDDDKSTTASESQTSTTESTSSPTLNESPTSTTSPSSTVQSTTSASACTPRPRPKPASFLSTSDSSSSALSSDTSNSAVSTTATSPSTSSPSSTATTSSESVCSKRPRPSLKTTAGSASPKNTASNIAARTTSVPDTGTTAKSTFTTSSRPASSAFITSSASDTSVYHPYCYNYAQGGSNVCSCDNGHQYSAPTNGQCYQTQPPDSLCLDCSTTTEPPPTTTAPQGYTTTDESGNVLGCATAGSMVVPGGSTVKTCDVEISTISAAPILTSVGQIKQSWDDLNDCGQDMMGDGGKDTTPCHMAYQKFDADKYYNNTALGYIYHKNGWGTSYGCKASFACEYDKMQDWLYPGEDILKAFDELWDDLGPHARCGYATTHSGCSVQLYPCNDNRFGKECKDEEYSVPADEWEL